MENSVRKLKEKELAHLRSVVTDIEKELSLEEESEPESGSYYLSYYATTGFFLGMVAASTSLVFNVIGSLLFEKEPLRLIKVYLTFPLGEQALAADFDNGLILAVGCCLYVATGMILGIPFNLVMTRLLGQGTIVTRLVLATLLSLAIWLVNYYGILYWLQPLLFQGNWIVATVPWWVAGLTHLVYGWTMAIIYPLGLYTPYRLETESA